MHCQYKTSVFIPPPHETKGEGDVDLFQKQPLPLSAADTRPCDQFSPHEEEEIIGALSNLLRSHGALLGLSGDTRRYESENAAAEGS